MTPMATRLPWLEDGTFPIYLAPMAGFTDPVFRELCRNHGADVVVSEFVMANKFLDERGQVSAWETVDFSESQRPMGIQIFGSDPSKMGAAAVAIVERMRPDFIDINYGCPAPRVVDHCAGSSLLKDLPRLQWVARSVVAAVSEAVPVTAKIRTGWDSASIVALEAGRRLEDVGVEALAIHGRTKVQGYRGEADWDLIQQTAARLNIPVIGNGGIDTGFDLAGLRAHGLVRGAMVGRAALGNPWIFGRLRARLDGRADPGEPNAHERWSTVLRYAESMLGRPRHGCQWDHLGWMRPRIQAFLKGMPGSRQARARIEKVRSYDDLNALAEQQLSALEDGFTGPQMQLHSGEILEKAG